jgi:hypothetical protein
MNYYDEAIEAYDQWIQFFSPNDIFNL